MKNKELPSDIAKEEIKNLMTRKLKLGEETQEIKRKIQQLNYQLKHMNEYSIPVESKDEISIIKEEWQNAIDRIKEIEDEKNRIDAEIEKKERLYNILRNTENNLNVNGNSNNGNESKNESTKNVNKVTRGIVCFKFFETGKERT